MLQRPYRNINNSARFRIVRNIILILFLCFNGCRKPQYSSRIYDKIKIGSVFSEQNKRKAYIEDDHCGLDACNRAIRYIKANNKNFTWVDNVEEADYIFRFYLKNRTHVEGSVINVVKNYMIMVDSSPSFYVDATNAPHLLSSPDMFNFSKDGIIKTIFNSSGTKYAIISGIGITIGTSFIPGFNILYAALAGIGTATMVYASYEGLFAEVGTLFIFELNVSEKQPKQSKSIEKVIKRISENVVSTAEYDKLSDSKDMSSKIIILGTNMAMLDYTILEDIEPVIRSVFNDMLH